MPTNTDTDTDARPTVTVEDRPADSYPRRTLLVDFLFLDRDRCDRCRGTEASLHEALERLEPIFDVLDVEVVVRNVHVTSEVAARRTRLESSPTVRIDGRDVQPAFDESSCETCGDLCSAEAGINCRTWTYRGEQHAQAPPDLLLEALLRAALSPRDRARSAPREPYRVPENLQRFFGDDGSGPPAAERTDPCC
ncbi:DUF2703 domain-containing protein [Halopiger aswanensis]|uniref:Uncharacterized protein DUF2703 n=1 Tax=Halopiger aswanensis TaxID=148449 RepID=A0A3R7DAJ4_9EURY|nr:DUF2703 domain-containing protein [Halopiger aswanensis]RKD88141.1 uncharacterized protein DUF2703 [Halopiger aswanensis]